MNTAQIVHYYYRSGGQSSPTVQASNLVFSNVSDTSFTLSWTSGNGAGRIVLIKSGSAVDGSPSSNTTYTADDYFSAGDQIGSGNYVVYNSTGSSISVDGLSANTTHHVAIIEYNGTAGAESYGTAATSSQATLWSPLVWGNDLQMWISASNSRAMFQENGVTGVQLTTTDTDTQPVGFVYDRGINCLSLNAISDATRPILASSGGRSYFDFDGTNHRMRFSTSKKIFTEINSASPVFTIIIACHVDVDGTNVSFLDSNDGSASTAGFFIQRLGATNRIQTISYGGGICWNFTSTPTFTAADGRTVIVLSVNGAGTNTGSLKIGSNAAQTFNVTAGNASESSTECFVGARAQTADRKLNGGLYDIAMSGTIVSAGDITNFTNMNIPRNSARFIRKNIDYNFNDTSKQWADTGKTTPITNGTALRVIENWINPNFGTSGFKDAVSPSASESPTYQSAILNSLGAVLYDGTNDDLVLGAAEASTGGRFTIVAIFQSTKTTTGSHIAFGSQYIVETANDYVGNVSNGGNPYLTWHTNGGNSGLISKKNLSGANVYVLTRNLNSLTVWNGLKNKITQTDSNAFSISRIGKEFLVGWWMGGYYARFIMYQDVLPDKMIRDIIDSFNSQYAI